MSAKSSDVSVLSVRFANTSHLSVASELVAKVHGLTVRVCRSFSLATFEIRRTDATLRLLAYHQHLPLVVGPQRMKGIAMPDSRRSDLIERLARVISLRERAILELYDAEERAIGEEKAFERALATAAAIERHAHRDIDLARSIE